MGFFRPAGAVGLELDAGEVRAVELRGTPRTPRLVAWGRQDLPEGAVVEGAVTDPKAVAAALERLWAAAGIGSRDVVLGIANQGVLIRLGTVPKVPENKLAQLIRYQAQDYLPIPLNQAVLDFAVVGQTTGGNGPLLEVLLVAAKRDMLQSFLEALSVARLNVTAIDAAPLALLNAVLTNERRGTVAVVNVGNGLSHILIAADGMPRFARLIPVSLQDAVKSFGLSLGDAEPDEAGAEPGTARQRRKEKLRAWCDNVTGEINSSIGYYLAQPGSAGVDRIVISGRGARLAGLAEYMAERLDLRVEKVRPLEGVTVQPGCEHITREVLDFAVCIGLARRGLEGAK